MHKKYVIAYDFGTSGVKACLVDTEGTIEKITIGDYPLYCDHPHWAEQDPNEYWSAVCKVTNEIVQASGIDTEQIIGLAFGTIWKGIIPVDSDGNVLHRSIIWLDSRCEEQANALNELMRRHCFDANDYWPKLLWLKQNKPEICDKAVVIHEVNSFLKWKATGAVASDISNSFIKSFDPEINADYKKIIDFIGIPWEKFPDYVHCHDEVGKLNEKGAQELGLSEGIPVFGGDTDLVSIPIGSGCSKLGGVHAYFGSSGWLGYTVPHKDFDLMRAPFDEERDVIIDGLNSIGLSLNWAIDTLYRAEKEIYGSKTVDFVNKDIEDVPAGCKGLLATPWLFGEQPPCFGLNATAAFIGLHSYHDRRFMIKAIMEGVCYSLRIVRDHAKEAYGLDVNNGINACGGGSLSDSWMQILADCLNTEVRVPHSPQYAGAVGTAYCALVGLGICDDFSDVDKHIKFDRVFSPIPENVKIYDKGYEVFKDLYMTLEKVFKYSDEVGEQND